jgi:hypothetical protein
MGHHGCGAEPKYIARLLKQIIPGIQNLDPRLSGDARINSGVGARPLLESEEFRLIRAVYELGSSRVRFLD